MPRSMSPKEGRQRSSRGAATKGEAEKKTRSKKESRPPKEPRAKSRDRECSLRRKLNEEKQASKDGSRTPLVDAVAESRRHSAQHVPRSKPSSQGGSHRSDLS